VIAELLARLIERRFGGYRHLLEPIDTSLPATLSTPRRVAVIGAGLAGIGAAIRLAERGFSVVLLERNHYLGGKVGAWKINLPDGREVGVQHGFHAFFRHYYNLNRFFDQVGVARNLRTMEDYLILTVDGRNYSFKDIATTPILNLLSLARHTRPRTRRALSPHADRQLHSDQQVAARRRAARCRQRQRARGHAPRR
jgi:carotenoid phi-ring synthase / carotenoid chi-ring synthase